MSISYQATIKNPFNSLEDVNRVIKDIETKLENLNVEDSSDSIAIDYYERELFALDMFAGEFVFLEETKEEIK
ncbi:hypothetical protein ACU6QT_000508 [Listeria monocytogenes]|nr:hypothetical protein [Listeria monocytogenes]EIZ2814146.1 hypothetical protein [Listeria monocytogenes]EIZ2817034.1 hypothetical protein [Listeria monocytogenes]EJH5250464.1 hypothetical protein [Listeria monocytogenes]MCW41980.1 hypothetical protein [Listeria monocytogenes]